MWIDIIRVQFSREELRLLGGDLTDAEWVVLERLLPAQANRGRRPE